MAKTKMSERRDYTLGKNDVITYKKSSKPRQSQFMILRGPGLNVQEAIAENEEIKKLSIKNRFKVKFMHANTVEEVLEHLADANTWATGVVYQLGKLVDENLAIQKKMKRLLIPMIEIKDQGAVSSVVEGLKQLSK